MLLAMGARRLKAGAVRSRVELVLMRSVMVLCASSVLPAAWRM